MPQRCPPSRPDVGKDPAIPAPCADEGIDSAPAGTRTPPAAPEIGGPPGPEPTRYGDWEHKGRCTDF